jgi:hypothetical protein
VPAARPGAANSGGFIEDHAGPLDGIFTDVESVDEMVTGHAIRPKPGEVGCHAVSSLRSVIRLTSAGQPSRFSGQGSASHTPRRRYREAIDTLAAVWRLNEAQLMRLLSRG